MQELKQLASEFDIVLSDNQVAQFARYQELLLDWNQRMNLTRIVAPDEIVIRHFLDSLTCATVTGDLSGLRAIDLGTGAGFPGLPLKILYPEMQLTLADSVTKKTHFLQAVVDALGLTEVRVVAERAETLGQSAEFRAQFDWVMARAVAQLRVLAEYLLPLARVGGRVLAQKGGTAAREIAEAEQAVATLGGETPRVYQIDLPRQESPHFLVEIGKSAETPPAYPRKPGRPTKRPL